MKPFQHILCPTDFSPSSRHAQDLALTLANDFQARLTLFHSVDSPVYSSWPTVPQPEFAAERQRWAKKEMAALEASLASPRVGAKLGEGPPHQAIAREAARDGVDLVVMGTHGLSGFEKLFLGSTTEKVLHLVETPLLTVNPSSRKPEPSAGKGKAFRNIVLAADFGPGTVATAEYALLMGRQYRSRITAVHAHPRPLEMSHELAASWFQAVELDRAAATLKLRKLIPPSVREVCETDFVAREGEPFEIIRQVAQEVEADLVVMGAHGTGKSGLAWLGSTAHKMIRAAQCPVLVVRRSA